MTCSPLVSVIMPAFNASAYIAESIQSVLDQTFVEFELIVVDDGSIDKTRNIVDSYRVKDSRIILHCASANQGVAAARNKGVELARGKYIAFLDADDLWMPNKLEAQVELLESGGADIVCSAYHRFFVDDTEVLVVPPKRINYARMLRGNPIGNLTGIYNCHKLGKFYQMSIGHEDYAMWISLVKASGFAVGMHEPLAKYRVLEKSVSSNKFRAAFWVWQIYRTELGMNILISGACFFRYITTAVFSRVFKATLQK